MLEEQHVSISSHQTCGNPEQSSLLVDKTTTVSEVACENLETAYCNENKVSHNFVTKAEHIVRPNNEKVDEHLGSQSGWNATNSDANE